eukprot:CAMPEP_0175020484 /NCGR_PEP_ID=MMETSP0005-20121125/14156_1 /TAXON_ID=420556 /ORGANISM="Ochromonas sp., Strain CCMP1393" /LENGTH=54 /DNA_ID=CAMNT_0016278369 /DNA_START=434 /DNA_END=598 /DNA_ORIENTATION=+
MTAAAGTGTGKYGKLMAVPSATEAAVEAAVEAVAEMAIMMMLTADRNAKETETE